VCQHREDAAATVVGFGDVKLHQDVAYVCLDRVHGQEQALRKPVIAWAISPLGAGQRLRLLKSRRLPSYRQVSLQKIVHIGLR
jgi:hypothetical protein